MYVRVECKVRECRLVADLQYHGHETDLVSVLNLLGRVHAAILR